MKLLSRIWFPAAVLVFASAGAVDFGSSRLMESRIPSPEAFADTVIYEPYAYRFDPVTDSSLLEFSDSLDDEEMLDFGDSLANRLSPRDSLKALLDSSLWDKIDSIYIADSIAKAKAKFEAWYNSLSPKERRKYDAEQRMNLKAARADSLRLVKEEKQNIRDSIIAETPRILETYAIPDSMQYKRIISWTVDQDFHQMDIGIPDTSFNYRFYDYPFQRNDVNASWLGVAGSAVQYYDYFKRKSNEGVDFYDAYESWSFSPGTLPHYNTKTPYTELAYFGTLLATDEKESDNLHIFTTQNITPELNFSLLYDRFGGGGILENEETINKTAVVQTNYLGKKYMMHAGYIYNKISQRENGGINDLMWIRDTTVDGRDIRVNLTDARSEVKKNTFFLDQQLRIPFNFIMKMRAKKDSTLTFDSDSLMRDVTTAFIGHSTEFSTYTRKYTDNITDDIGREYYNNVFYYNPSSSADTMRVMKLDNKFFIRLQPWSSEGIVSKLDVGVGDELRTYFDSTLVRPQKHTENSFYIYGGAEGQLRNNFFWNAKARFDLIGYKAGDFDVSADGRFDFYPFRRARKSRRAKFGKGVISGKRIACFQRFKFFKIGDQPFCFVRQVAVRAARFSGGVFRRNGELRHVIGGGERIDHLHDCRGRLFHRGHAGMDGGEKFGDLFFRRAQHAHDAAQLALIRRRRDGQIDGAGERLFVFDGGELVRPREQHVDALRGEAQVFRPDVADDGEAREQHRVGGDKFLAAFAPELQPLEIGMAIDVGDDHAAGKIFVALALAAQGVDLDDVADGRVEQHLPKLRLQIARRQHFRR